MMTSNAAFKKRVRELASQHDIPYSEARSRLLRAEHAKSGAGDSPAATSGAGDPTDRYAQIIGTAVIAHARAIAEAHRLDDSAELAWVEEKERDGLRVVTSGQDGSPDADGRSDWSIADWRTGQTIASGHSTLDEIPWAKDWIDISNADALGLADYDETAVIAALSENIAPPLRSFILDLVAGMDDEDWPRDFAEWLNEDHD
jgi:hypothetical protein